MIAVASWGCSSPRSTKCDFDLICPQGTLCNKELRACVTVAQLQACADRDDGVGCTFGDVLRGSCSLGVCLAAACGNGRLDPGERCDDGNLQDGDGCSANCSSTETCGNGVVDSLVGEACDCGADESVRPGVCVAANGAFGAYCDASCSLRYCGNGEVEPGEGCDDGNWTAGDGCDPICLSDERCGNGILDLQVGEQCDDGNQLSGDGCSESCGFESCGNGQLETGEVCDDGNARSGDGCSFDCLSDETCGNGVVDAALFEQCDCGSNPNALSAQCAAPNGDPDSRCDATCQLRFCGDGQLNPGEVCDDGNVTLGDGCSSDCLSDESCGNGRLDYAVGETCDCGGDPSSLPQGCLAPNGDPASPCTLSCGARYCGNGVTDPWEACDDGNSDSGDGCRADCLSDERCGNGLTDLWAGETCDCGDDPSRLPADCVATNGAPSSHCSVGCRQRYCGNGVVDPGETCDDGNRDSGDGCRGDCLSDESCGNGLIDAVAGETCDDGNTWPGDGCSADCRLQICGNGLLDPGEACDDGNHAAGDGCSPDCLSDESCGNGVVDPGEDCDDGSTLAGDGCSPLCTRELGWTCQGAPSVCAEDCAGVCCTQTQIPVLECVALAALYDDTAGIGWADNTGWMLNGQPCSWSGITCVGGRVTGVWLVSNNLVGTLPPELALLDQLTYLRLAFNGLHGSIPPELGQLSALIDLDLSYNGLSGSIPLALGNLANLTELRLQDNVLSGSLPAALANLTALTHLEVGFNYFSGVIPPQLGMLSQLQGLRMFGCGLAGPIPPELGNLLLLEDLDLSSNNLSGTVPASLGNLVGSTQFRLSNNQLGGMLPATLTNLVNAEIRLGSNQCFTAETPALELFLNQVDPLWNDGC